MIFKRIASYCHYIFFSPTPLLHIILVSLPTKVLVNKCWQKTFQLTCSRGSSSSLKASILCMSSCSCFRWYSSKCKAEYRSWTKDFTGSNPLDSLVGCLSKRIINIYKLLHLCYAERSTNNLGRSHLKVQFFCKHFSDPFIEEDLELLGISLSIQFAWLSASLYC